MGWFEIFEEDTFHEFEINTDKNKTSILIVDDDEHITNGMDKYLSSKDYYVYCAKNGLEALEIYKTQSPQIIITDIIMPGMNGLDFLSAIRETDSDTEIIVISGHGDMKMAINAIKHSASDFLLKPVDFEMLLHSVQKSESHLKLKEDVKNYTQELEELFKDVHHSRDYLETILQNSPNATMTYDKDGLITSWNEAAENITGYSKAETIGKSVKEIFVFDKHLIDAGNGDIGDINQQSITGQIFTKNQDMRYISRNANTLVDQGSNVIGGIESFFDITEKTNSDRLLEKRYMQVQTINEIGKKVAASVEVGDLIDFVSVRLVKTFFESANIFFLLGNGRKDRLKLRAASGILINEILKKHPIGKSINIKNNIIGNVFRNGKSHLNTEISDEKKGDCCFSKDVFSSYTFPIKSNNISYGVLHIENSEKLELDDSQHFELYQYTKEKGLGFVETLCAIGCLSMLKLFTLRVLYISR